MVCIFCYSHWHRSKSCTKYETEEARKQCPNSKRFCFSCYTESRVPHLRGEKKCKSNENCIGWFSFEHHKIFCPERFKAFKFFLPKIDNILMKRFVETFDIDEKYSFVLSSPQSSNLVPLKPIKIMDSFYGHSFNGFPFSDNVIVTEKMEFADSINFENNKNLSELINTNTLICLSKTLRIDYTKLPGDAILKLLSHHTKDFCLYDSHSSTTIPFSEIIKKAPNLEEISVFWTTTISFENTWIQDFLKYKNGKNLVLLRVMLDVVELDVETLVNFVKKKCIETAKIDIRFNRNLINNTINGKKFDAILKQVEKCFYWYTEEGYEDLGGLRIGFDQSNDFKYFSFTVIKKKVEKDKETEVELQPENKERIMPKRAATKRKYFESEI